MDYDGQSFQKANDKQTLQENQTTIYISDRRWKNLAADVLLLANCLWSEKEHMETIKNIVAQSVSRNLSLNFIFELEPRVARLADEYYHLCFLQEEEYKTKNFNGIPHY